MKINLAEIIQKYYNPQSELYRILTEHGKLVAKKALALAEKVKHLNPDLKLIEEAAMLHDIGIFLTKAPKLECFGEKPYICHGYLGREILEKENLPKHALVCERHTGMGLTIDDIEKQNLPIPKRDMVPISIEEKIICFADKFYSKDPESLFKEKMLEEIKNNAAKFGENEVKKFEEFIKLFYS